MSSNVRRGVRCLCTTEGQFGAVLIRQAQQNQRCGVKRPDPHSRALTPSQMACLSLGGSAGKQGSILSIGTAPFSVTMGCVAKVVYLRGPRYQLRAVRVGDASRPRPEVGVADVPIGVEAVLPGAAVPDQQRGYQRICPRADTCPPVLHMPKAALASEGEATPTAPPAMLARHALPVADEVEMPTGPPTKRVTAVASTADTVPPEDDPLFADVPADVTATCSSLRWVVASPKKATLHSRLQGQLWELVTMTTHCRPRGVQLFG